MVYAQPSTCTRKYEQTQTPIGLWHTNRSPNLGQKTRPNNQQKKKICKIIDFALPVDQRIKLKECEKRDKYLDLTIELKKTWDMKVTIILIVIGAFGTVIKVIVIDAFVTVTEWLVKGMKDWERRGRAETIETTAFLRKARILRRVLKTWGDFLSLRLQWMTIS